MSPDQDSPDLHSPLEKDLSVLDRLEILGDEVRGLREILESDQIKMSGHPGPIIPLEVAAEEFFHKSPDVVMRWVKKGLLSAIALPNGKRGHYYYFNLEKLLEELDENFTR